MAGHSKWSQIKHQKGANDAKRGALFTKLGNAITMAAKSGGGDPDMNFSLRLAIDKAKGSNMPKDNIERAVKRGTGELEGAAIEEITYEGFASDGIALIIECLTDNRNRTSSEIKYALTKAGGSLGGPNAVSWMFDHVGVVETQKITEEQQLELIDAGANDFSQEDQVTHIFCSPADLQKIKDAVEKIGKKINAAEIEYKPKEPKALSSEEAAKFQKLYSTLEELDDVSNIYTNAELSE